MKVTTRYVGYRTEPRGQKWNKQAAISMMSPGNIISIIFDVT
jgi:hypothetical protein